MPADTAPSLESVVMLSCWRSQLDQLILRAVRRRHHTATRILVQVVLAGLELANALVISDASVLETMCLVGIVPTVARFAAASWPRGIRLQAALFVQQLCRTSLATAQMFVACQVMPCFSAALVKPAGMTIM